MILNMDIIGIRLDWESLQKYDTHHSMSITDLRGTKHE